MKLKLLTPQEVASLTEEQAAERIRLLRNTYRAELAVPLMMEGNISPMQVGMMSERQRAKWQHDGQVKMLVEAEIRQLTKPHSQRVKEITARQKKETLGSAQSRLTQIAGILPTWCALGLGAKNKLKPTYQREVDNALAEVRDIFATFPELADAETLQHLNVESCLAKAIAERAARAKR